MKQITIAIIIITVIATTAFFFNTGCGINENGDPTPTPTPGNTLVPTVVPAPTTNPSAGTVWLHPGIKTVNINVDDHFMLDVYVNSGDPGQKVAGYGFDVIYETTMISVNTAIGKEGVEAGDDGFVAAALDKEGVLSISGFDVSGTGPGTELHFLIIHFIAKSTGYTTINMEVDKLTDADTNDIGVPTGRGSTVGITG